MEVFEDKIELEKFKKILLSWEGTPFRYLAMVKGRGIDCSLYTASCLHEYGVLKEIQYEHYSKDWFIHTGNEVILAHLYYHVANNFIEGYTLVEKNIQEEIKEGDILTFSTTKKKLSNHTSIYLDKKNNTMIHALNGRGVCVFLYGSFWKEKLTHIFRLEKK